MPSFIRNDKDERDWLRAKEIVRGQYPDVEEGSESFWKLVNHVFHSMSGRRKRSVTEEIAECLEG